MNRTTADNAGAARQRHGGAASRVRGMVCGLAVFAAGLALGAWWFSRALSATPAAAPESSGPPGLSEATLSVLRRLGSPVEIRFYSVLDPVSAGESGRQFSGRVDQLLSQYEREGGGKIKVARVNTNSAGAANAAMADGIKPFNLDKGDACFLGIAVVCGGQKESLATLSPEWEPALESDLSRAIAGVAGPGSLAQPAARVDDAALDAVRQAIPNLDSVTMEEGSRALRAAALARFERTSQEFQTRVKQAEEHFRQAQNSPSEAEQDAALKDLQEVRKEQAQKLTGLALEARAEQEALQQLKAAGH
jgi:hypothetical protein